MTENFFFSLDEVEPGNLATCGDGYFKSFQAERFANVLVTTFDGTRHIVYLNDPRGAMIVPMQEGDGSDILGLLWPTPIFEVDPTSMYNPERTREGLGNLIVGPKPMIFARQPDSPFDDGERVPLWGEECTAAKAIAFRSWRIISVIGDTRTVLFERKIKPAPAA